MERAPPADDRFAAVVRQLLIARGTTMKNGNADWAAFVNDSLKEKYGVGYETLRKALAGDRTPSVKVMESVAAALDIEPTDFAEYRLEVWRRQFEPSEVGLDVALENFRRYEAR